MRIRRAVEERGECRVRWKSIGSLGPVVIDRVETEAGGGGHGYELLHVMMGGNLPSMEYLGKMWKVGLDECPL